MNQLEEAWNKLKHEVQATNVLNSFNTGAIIANNMLSSLKNVQNTVLDTVTDIYHGRFNFHLLPPEQLVKELSIISTKLRKDITLPIDNIHTELRKVYELLRVRTRMLEDVLMFEMKLPLLTRDTYEILKIIPVPAVDKDQSISVVPVADYISINMKRDVFIKLSEKDLRSCLQLSNVNFCYILKPEYQVKDDKSFCQQENMECMTITRSCSNDWSEVNYLNTYLYFCCDRCHIKTICGDQVTAHQLTRGGLIHVGEDCIIKSEDFSIFPHKLHLTEITMNPELYTPHMASINHIINITIPKLIITNDSQQQELSEIGQSIKKMKEADVVYESISYHDIHHYTMIYVALGTIAIISVVIVARRARCSWRVPRAPAARCPDTEMQSLPPAPAAAPAPAPAPRDQAPLRQDRSSSPHLRFI